MKKNKKKSSFLQCYVMALSQPSNSSLKQIAYQLICLTLPKSKNEVNCEK